VAVILKGITQAGQARFTRRRAILANVKLKAARLPEAEAPARAEWENKVTDRVRKTHRLT
jgi:hypothetical protein